MKEASRGMVGAMAVAVALLSGCGDESAGAAAPRTVKLELDAFEAPAGGEGLVCQTFASALAGDAEVTAWTSTLDRGGHHMLVFPSPGAKDAPLAPCAANDGASAPIFQGQKTGRQTLTYPEGVSQVIPDDVGLIVQIHYANATADTLTIRNSVELTLADPGTAATHLAPIQLDNFDIAVPPGTTLDVSKSCTMAEDTDVIWLVSHSHAHATAVHASVGDSPLYETSTPQEPPMKVFDPPRRVKKGESITYACTYENPSAKEIGWGDSLEDDEMCVMVGAYADASGQAPRIRCEDASGGCMTCLQALTQNQPEKLCTDDGPPSAKEIYDAMQACVCGGGCGEACGDSACAAGPPSDACRACIETTCVAESDACFGGG